MELLPLLVRDRMCAFPKQASKKENVLCFINVMPVPGGLEDFYAVGGGSGCF
jgi:hypothetical protein